MVCGGFLVGFEKLGSSPLTGESAQRVRCLTPKETFSATLKKVTPTTLHAVVKFEQVQTPTEVDHDQLQRLRTHM